MGETQTNHGCTLPDRLQCRVLDKLGWSPTSSNDLQGLRTLYQSWCLRVPFDNVRKMIALGSSDPGPLPGGHAEDFFEAWLAHRCGGTCWPSSNALFEILGAAGFEVRRITGFMRDLGIVNHASVRVTAEGRDWLADSSMLTNEPLPLGEAVFHGRDPVVPAVVEPDGNGHLAWFTMLPNSELLPCRVKNEPADHAFYLQAYEVSREKGPFNQRLYARRNYPGEIRVLIGSTRFAKNAHGVESRELTRAELRHSLRTDIGISEEMIERWVRAGGLEASMQPAAGPKPPAPARKPPPPR